jgi:DNA primase
MKSQELSFAAIKQAVRMEAVLRHYQVKDLQGRGGRYRGRCPIHQGEGREAFHVDVKRKIFHCFSCGAGGDVLDLVSLLDKCTIREAAGHLKDRFAGVAGCGGPLLRQRVTKGNISANLPLKFQLRGVDGGHAYLATRQIDGNTATRFGMGFYGGPGIMSGRVVIPIHDEWGRLVAYAGRSVDSRQPRYRFPAGFGKSQVLFNYHRAATTAEDTVILVEGFFDCLRVAQAGFENVVSLLGIELYERPAELLSERFRRVLLMLDGDVAGRQGRGQVVSRLRDRCEVDVIELPEGAQPDQLPDDELRQLIKSAEGNG